MLKQDEMEKQILLKVDEIEKTETALIGYVHNVRMMVKEYVSTLVSSYEDEPKKVFSQTTINGPPIEPVQKLDAWEAVCSDCGQTTTVKFKPNPKWPVRCLDCYKKHKENMKND